MKPFICQNSIKQRSSYLRTHLANGCLDSIAIKHRCSQSSELCRLVLRAECSSWRRSLVGLSRCCWGAGYFSNSSLQNRCWGYFCFVPFFVKAKILFGFFFFLVTENRYSDTMDTGPIFLLTLQCGNGENEQIKNCLRLISTAYMHTCQIDVLQEGR